MFGWAFQWIVNTCKIKPFFLHPDRKLLLRGQLQRQLVGQNIRLQRRRRPLCCKAGTVWGIVAGPFVEAHLWNRITSTLTWRWIACAWCQPRSLIKHTHICPLCHIPCHRSSGNTVKPCFLRHVQNLAWPSIKCRLLPKCAEQEMLFWKKAFIVSKMSGFQRWHCEFWQVQSTTS